MKPRSILEFRTSGIRIMRGVDVLNSIVKYLVENITVA